MNKNAKIGGLAFWLALVATILAVIALGLAILLYAESWLRPDGWQIANTVELGTLAILLASLWVYVPIHEYRLLDRIAGNLSPSEPGELFVSVLVSVVALVALFPAALAPAIFAAVLVLLKAVEAWNSWRANVEIRIGAAIVDAATDLPEELEGETTLSEWKSEAHTHSTYYFGHCWDPLRATVVAMVALAGMLAAATMGDSNPDVRHIGPLAATLVIVAAVVGNEVLIGRWRAQRDGRLPVRLLSG